VSQTVEKPRVGGPGTGHGDDRKVIVLNDDHNTFDHVASTLARYVPSVSIDQGFQLANKIHSAGRAIVWSGDKERAELIWEQCKDAGLTMAPLT